MRSSINSENISDEEMMSGAMGVPAVDEAGASFALVVGVEEGDETEHSAGVCSPPAVSRLRFETESDTGDMEHGHGMLIDWEAKTSSVGGAWGMGRSLWSWVAEASSVDGGVDMGSMDFARHSASS